MSSWSSDLVIFILALRFKNEPQHGTHWFTDDTKRHTEAWNGLQSSAQKQYLSLAEESHMVKRDVNKGKGHTILLQGGQWITRNSTICKPQNGPAYSHTSVHRFNQFELFLNKVSSLTPLPSYFLQIFQDSEWTSLPKMNSVKLPWLDKSWKGPLPMSYLPGLPSSQHWTHCLPAVPVFHHNEILPQLQCSSCSAWHHCASTVCTHSRYKEDTSLLQECWSPSP